jgi:Bacterial low temperature requirement A protein (LtrA)
MTTFEETRAHRLRVMSGRDPNKRHRTATPLELLYDLTFVVAFGVAGEQFAHRLAEGHFAAGLTAFGLAIFAICWAWINFSWFASAYDTDDWAFRLATMVQMVGVIILSLGLPQVFHSIDEGRPVDNSVTVDASGPHGAQPRRRPDGYRQCSRRDRRVRRGARPSWPVRGGRRCRSERHRREPSASILAMAERNVERAIRSMIGDERW